MKTKTIFWSSGHTENADQMFLLHFSAWCGLNMAGGKSLLLLVELLWYWQWMSWIYVSNWPFSLMDFCFWEFSYCKNNNHNWGILKATPKETTKIHPPVVKPCFKISFVYTAWHFGCDIRHTPSAALLSWHFCLLCSVSNKHWINSPVC